MTHHIAKLAFAGLLSLFPFVVVAANPATTPATAPAANAAAKPASSARVPRPTITIVNLNTADAATLARDMDGIGETKARAIVEHRKSKGAFRSVDELALVKGIGSKTVERNRSRSKSGPSKSEQSKPAPATRAAPGSR